MGGLLSIKGPSPLRSIPVEGFQLSIQVGVGTGPNLSNSPSNLLKPKFRLSDLVDDQGANFGLGPRGSTEPN